MRGGGWRRNENKEMGEKAPHLFKRKIPHSGLCHEMSNCKWVLTGRWGGVADEARVPVSPVRSRGTAQAIGDWRPPWEFGIILVCDLRAFSNVNLLLFI